MQLELQLIASLASHEDLRHSAFSRPYAWGRFPARAQEWPYFVTYSHDLEEPDNLEVALKTTQATPKFGNFFSGATLELEYGARGWWTTELYLSGQHTSNDSTVFTGFRWENRFRPLLRDHFINPVLYFEYENLNRADRSLLEVVGHDSISDLRLSNAQGRSDTERELETEADSLEQREGMEYFREFHRREEFERGRALGIRVRPWC